MDLRALGMKGGDLVGRFVTSSVIFETKNGDLYEEGTVWRVTGKKGFKFNLSKWRQSRKKGETGWTQDVVRGVPPGAFELCKAEPVKMVFRRLARGSLGVVFFPMGQRFVPSEHHITDKGRLTMTFDALIIEEAAPDEEWPPSPHHPGREDAMVFDRPDLAPREAKRDRGRPRKKAPMRKRQETRAKR